MYAVAWSPDGGAFIAKDETPTQVTVYVFDKDGREIWSTPGITAAWTGSDSLVFLRKSATNASRTNLFEVSLPSGTPTQVEGSYLNFIIAAANGKLAIPTSETPRGFTFDLLNPAGGHFDGQPLLWSPAADKLAVFRGSHPLIGVLDIVDAASGSVTRTGLAIAPYGVAFDHTGSRLLVCVEEEGTCTPTLVTLNGGSTVASTMSSELHNAGELSDGRWIGGNAGEVVVWDPRDPTVIVRLGPGDPSVLPSGTVAIIGDETPALASLAPEAVFVSLSDPSAHYVVWSPAGDRVAYSVSTTSGEELRIAIVP